MAAEIITIEQESTALQQHLQGLSDVQKVWDYEPAELGKLPVITVLFVGFGDEEMANFRHSKEIRNYDIRLYVGLDDWEGGYRQMTRMAKPFWEKVISVRRFNDAQNIRFSTVGGLTIENIVDDQKHPLLVAKTTIALEHQTRYVPD